MIMFLFIQATRFQKQKRAASLRSRPLTDNHRSVINAASPCVNKIKIKAVREKAHCVKKVKRHTVIAAGR